MNESIVPSEVFNSTSKMGGYSFPFVSEISGWSVSTFKFPMGKEQNDLLKQLKSQKPSLRIVKDDGTMEIETGETEAQFLKRSGIVINKPFSARTPKRLSRVLRPSKWFKTFPASEITIETLEVDTDLWDGINWISAEFAFRMGLPEAGRYEGTVMTADGQAKGHFLTVPAEWMNGADIGIPQKSWKKEIAFKTGAFVDMRPFHGKNHLLSDIQSLVNIYHELFTNSQLMEWLHVESTKFIDAMKYGDAEERMLYMLDRMTIEQVQGYSVFEFIASGGRLAESANMTRQFGKAWVNRLTSFRGGLFDGELYDKGVRLPIKGGFRLYLTNASALKASCQSGEVIVSFENAAIIVSDDDYKTIAKTLGGGDQDDAVNCITDGKDMIGSRNPNGRGEFVILRIANPDELAKHHIDPVVINWAALKDIKPNTKEIELPRLTAPDTKDFASYSNWLMEKTAKRIGVLGRHVNVLTSYLLVRGEDAPNQPAMLEQVIDACAKDLDIDLSSVQKWDIDTAKELVKLPMPLDAIRRCSFALEEDEKAINDDNHWLDNLVTRVNQHIDWFNGQVRHLAEAATPPQEVYGCINEESRQLRNIYNSIIKVAIATGEPTDEDFINARLACEKFLSESETPEKTLLGAYALSGFSGSDAVCWQKGIIAETTLKALRNIDVLGTLSWTGESITCSEVEPRWALNHISVNGVWFNIWPGKPANATSSDMAKCPNRAALKQNVANRSKEQIGRTVYFKQQGERTVCLNDKGTFLGFVGKGQKDRIGDKAIVIEASAFDGNLQLIVF